MSRIVAKKLTSTGAVTTDASVLVGLYFVDGATAGRVQLTDVNGGDTLLDIDTAGDSDNHFLPLPGTVEGRSGLYLNTLTTVSSITVFYRRA
ncbi:MAG TPA: hypothetical protein VKA19_02425 [Alphaproteobacteria bacterium]|nr:hypothetical protein [Alphaproteobacteria bacterium]